MDGTLLTPEGRVTGECGESIAEARAAGVRVVLNTGRPIPEARYFAGEAGCDDLISCLGGAALVIHLAGLESFGVSYLTPFAVSGDGDSEIIRRPAP